MIEIEAPESAAVAPSRREEAYQRILRMVVYEMAGEQNLLSEQRLTEEFGMSRAPVREALRTLCAERILEAVPRAGYRAVPISLNETLDALEVRLLLETEVVRRVCRRRDPATLAQLDALIADESAPGQPPLGDMHPWLVAGDRVHLTLAAMTRNIVLEREVARLIDLLRRASVQIIMRAGGLPEGMHYHRQILDALRRGDEEQAVAAMRKDVMILHAMITTTG